MQIIRLTEYSSKLLPLLFFPQTGQVVTNKRLLAKELKQVRVKYNHSERHVQLNWASHN
jgi:hypothetical protein